MIRFKHRYCKVHMARFVNGDLAEPARRRVARYIDECQDCYREYRQHREFAHKLERSLPSLGKPGAPKLDKIWSALQAEIESPPVRHQGRGALGASASLRFSAGLVIVAITLALLLPMMIGIHSAGLAIDLPHKPRQALARGTPAGASASAAVIGATAEPAAQWSLPLLQNTPSPR